MERRKFVKVLAAGIAVVSITPNAFILGKTELSLTNWDPQAWTYIEAIGLEPESNYTLKGGINMRGIDLMHAVNDFFLDLKSSGVYDKMQACYPLMGSTNEKMAGINMISPGKNDRDYVAIPAHLNRS